MTDWNKAQLKVLESLKDDRNILVSAAAGSGKTAVLVERIIRSVTEKRCGIDELLVVTFTRAAAAQMKTKIIKALEKICEDGGNPHMVKQLSLAENADITTIDSFALRVIREFFYRTDNEPDFRACDEVQGEMMRRDALAELFEFTPINMKEYGIAMGLAILIIPIVEIIKAFQRASARRKGEELRS